MAPNCEAWDDQVVDDPKQVIVMDDEGNYRLTYKTDVYSLDPLGRKLIYIDVLDEHVLAEKDMICHARAEGTAITKYSGVKTIITEAFEGKFRLRDTTRGGGVSTFDMNQQIRYRFAVDFIDDDNFWDDTTNLDDVAYDAHFGAQTTYDFYLETFGRNSFDNKGTEMLNYVHFDMNMNNAFWDGERMTYGDGDGVRFLPFVSLGVVAHEITHGVVEFSADLSARGEPGALNESFCDILGTGIEFHEDSSLANYIIGDEFDLDGVGTRSMEDPKSLRNPDTYQGGFWVDNGVVHSNGGVQNFWFYLLSEGGSGTNDNRDDYSIEKIGMTKALQIAYRNLTTYLTFNSGYADSRFYSIQSAIDLFGDCSEEVIQTTNAWFAVGVGEAYIGDSNLVSDFSTDVEFNNIAPAKVEFENLSIDGVEYSWNFGDGNESLVESPSNVYSEPGTYVVELTVKGEFGCLSSRVDSITILDDIDGDNALVVFTGLNDGTVRITNKSSKNVKSISVMNILGKEVYGFSNNGDRLNGLLVDLNAQKEGVYFVRLLYEDDEYVVRKILHKGRGL